jgi:hypothetical protein
VRPVLQPPQGRFERRAVSRRRADLYIGRMSQLEPRQGGTTMKPNRIPTATRLLGLTPEQYTQRVEQAHREARRLRNEAMREFARALAARWQWLFAALCARLRRAAPAHAAEV